MFWFSFVSPQACRNGLVHHLEHLLAYGADMDSRNASGNTPLHVCAVNNQEACARMLLFRGANRGALNYSNQTPYQVRLLRLFEHSSWVCRGTICNRTYWSPFLLSRHVHQVAVIASNFELAEMIQNYKSDDIGEYRRKELTEFIFYSSVA